MTDCAAALGCAYETVRRYCLPFGDKDRRVPGEGMIEAIVDWSAGAVTAASFYPPRLNGGVAELDPVLSGRAS